MEKIVKEKGNVLKRIVLLLIVFSVFLVLMNYVYGDFFFTTNSSTAYNWSAGSFYQTKVVGVGDENG